MRYELGFIGAGNMAEPIARAAIDHRIVAAGRMIASDVSEARRSVFAGLGIRAVESNEEVIRDSAQVVIAVKPQMWPAVAPQLARHATTEQVLISIMAGQTTTKIASAIVAAGGTAARIVRVMPNTPLMVGLGMAGVCLSAGARPGDEALTLKLFGAAGKVVVVREDQMDAITAISGSGPAYVYYLAEAIEQAAAELGLGEHGRLLAGQTLRGAAKMLTDAPESSAELRRKVTSPGGTTEAAIRCMEAGKVAQTIVAAIKAARDRGVELGK